MAFTPANPNQPVLAADIYPLIAQYCDFETCDKMRLSCRAIRSVVLFNQMVIRFLAKYGLFECWVWAGGSGRLDVIRCLYFGSQWLPHFLAAAFQHAVMKARFNVLRFLLARRPENDTSEISFLDSMFWAARHGHVDVLKFLLDSMTTDEKEDCYRLFAFEAVGEGNVDVLRFVMDVMPDKDRERLDLTKLLSRGLEEASDMFSGDMVRFLIDAGASVEDADMCDSSPDTLLSKALRNWVDASVIRALMDHTDVCASDNLAIKNAIRHECSPEVLQILLESGASPNAYDYAYEHGIHQDAVHVLPILARAAVNRGEDLVNLLVEYKAHIKWALNSIQHRGEYREAAKVLIGLRDSLSEEEHVDRALMRRQRRADDRGEFYVSEEEVSSENDSEVDECVEAGYNSDEDDSHEDAYEGYKSDDSDEDEFCENDYDEV